MLSKAGFTHSDLLRCQNEYAGRSLNVNGTIMRDTYKSLAQASKDIGHAFDVRQRASGQGKSQG
ncbi:hypothetical protein E1N66_14985 [Pantoea allii]|nr:hypothetical protein E1N66_14985 [Pantoea allii]